MTGNVFCQARRQHVWAAITVIRTCALLTLVQFEDKLRRSTLFCQRHKPFENLEMAKLWVKLLREFSGEFSKIISSRQIEERRKRSSDSSNVCQTWWRQEFYSFLKSKLRLIFIRTKKIVKKSVWSHNQANILRKLKLNWSELDVDRNLQFIPKYN